MTGGGNSWQEPEYSDYNNYYDQVGHHDVIFSIYLSSLYSYDHLQPDHFHFIACRVRAVMDTATIATETMQQITAIEEFRHQGAKIKTK